MKGSPESVTEHCQTILVGNKEID
ncbi:unnamed protein product, partial [Allacma fusca]